MKKIDKIDNRGKLREEKNDGYRNAFILFTTFIIYHFIFLYHYFYYYEHTSKTNMDRETKLSGKLCNVNLCKKICC